MPLQGHVDFKFPPFHFIEIRPMKRTLTLAFRHSEPGPEKQGQKEGKLQIGAGKEKVATDSGHNSPFMSTKTVLSYLRCSLSNSYLYLKIGIF